MCKARNIEKFNYVKFGNYKDGKGKNRILIDKELLVKFIMLRGC